MATLDLIQAYFTLATSDWMLANQCCSNNTCVQLFKNQQIDSLVASYISQIFCKIYQLLMTKWLL